MVKILVTHLSHIYRLFIQKFIVILFVVIHFFLLLNISYLVTFWSEAGLFEMKTNCVYVYININLRMRGKCRRQRKAWTVSLRKWDIEEKMWTAVR